MLCYCQWQMHLHEQKSRPRGHSTPPQPRLIPTRTATRARVRPAARPPQHGSNGAYCAGEWLDIEECASGFNIDGGSACPGEPMSRHGLPSVSALSAWAATHPTQNSGQCKHPTRSGTADVPAVRTTRCPPQMAPRPARARAHATVRNARAARPCSGSLRS